jgi:hypothetical protein
MITCLQYREGQSDRRAQGSRVAVRPVSEPGVEPTRLRAHDTQAQPRPHQASSTAKIMRTYACHTWQVEDEDDEVVVDGEEEEDVMLVRPWRS